VKEKIEIQKMDEKSFDAIIKSQHYLHRANTTKPAIHYKFICKNQIVALQEWSAVFKPVLLRFPFLKHLEIIDNSRYLIIKEENLFEKVLDIYNLGSRALAMGIKRIKKDWFELTNVKPKLLITYVDQNRGFNGTVYKASNWIEIENSAGKNYSKEKKKDYHPTKKKTFIFPFNESSFDWRPVTFFDKDYLRSNWYKLNSLAQYNYKPK